MGFRTGRRHGEAGVASNRNNHPEARTTVIARQIGIVLCRVGAAVLTVHALRTLGYMLPGLVNAHGGFSSVLAGFFVLSILPGLVAVGLWVFADRISTIVDQSETPEDSRPLTDVDLVRIGTALIGMYLVISAVTYGVGIEVGNLARPELGPEHQSAMDEQAARHIGYRASYLAELIFGIALLTGRNRIAVLLARARYAGIDRN